MANLLPASSTQSFGFDAEASILALPMGKRYPINLFGGRNLKLSIKPDTIADIEGADVADDTKDTRSFTVVAKAEGTAVLTGKLPAAFNQWGHDVDFIQPLQVRVGPAAGGFRQASGTADKGGMGTTAFAEELRKLPWREAVMRVATDQMNSEVGRSTSGMGVYDGKGVNWCGSFVTWCYDVVAKARGVASPFGGGLAGTSALRSGIKALSYAMKNPDKFTVLNYEGSDVFDGGGTAIRTKRAVGTGVPVEMGDICLPRNQYGGFPHVCMVAEPPAGGSGAFIALDGNTYGSFVPSGMARNPGCIAYSKHENAAETLTIRDTSYMVNEKAEDGTTLSVKKMVQYPMGTVFNKWVFLHLTGF